MHFSVQLVALVAATLPLGWAHPLDARKNNDLVSKYDFLGCGTDAKKMGLRHVTSFKVKKFYYEVCGAICNEPYIATHGGDCYCSTRLSAKNVHVGEKSCKPNQITLYKSKKAKSKGGKKVHKGNKASVSPHMKPHQAPYPMDNSTEHGAGRASDNDNTREDEGDNDLSVSNEDEEPEDDGSNDDADEQEQGSNGNGNSSSSQEEGDEESQNGNGNNSNNNDDDDEGLAEEVGSIQTEINGIEAEYEGKTADKKQSWAQHFGSSDREGTDMDEDEDDGFGPDNDDDF